MAYATKEDMVKRFGAREVDDLLNQSSRDQDDHAGIVQAALDDASSEMDAFLAVTYALPLQATTWPQLVAIACDLARARFYDDAPPENVVNRRRSALARLRDLARGTMVLVAADGTIASRKATGIPADPDDEAFTADMDKYF